MVSKPIPTVDATSTPSASDLDSEWDDSRSEVISLYEAFGELSVIAQTDASECEVKSELGALAEFAEGGRKLLDATKKLPGKVCHSMHMTVAEVMRQMTKGCSIKFIAVIGLTGAGKSSIIRALTSIDVPVEDDINAGTTSFAMYPTISDRQPYILIDTPGFNDAKRSDLEIFQEILDWFVAMTPYCDLAGILYVHDITHNKFDGAASTTLDMLQALCGKEFYKNVTIVTTMWTTISDSAIRAAEKRQKRFEKGPWKELIQGGARVREHLEGFAQPDPDDPLTDQDIRELEKQCKRAKQELCEIMKYYVNSESVKPAIQHELRENIKVGLMDTKAGLVLRSKFNLPATPEQIDSDGGSNRIPSSPSCLTDNDGNLLPPLPPGTTVNVVHHHHYSPPPPPLPPKQDESEQGGGGDEQRGKEKGKRGNWIQNLLRAVKWFFTRS